MIKVIFFQESNGAIPVLDWLDNQQDRVIAKCKVKIDRLKELGNEIRRPEAAYLKKGIYELRIQFQGIQYRLLYFFYKQTAVVLSQGFIKKGSKVPQKQLELASKRRVLFENNPEKHTYVEGV